MPYKAERRCFFKQRMPPVYRECMADAQITYEQLFDALRREKSRDELQRLENGFYHLARVFLAEKQAMLVPENAGGYNADAISAAMKEAEEKP